jgi:hypothetical protein
MAEDIKDLLRRNIHWKEEVKGGIMFHANVDNDLCLLRMNDYPDEPLYTLSWRDLELDVDDKPEGWTF